MKQRASFFLCRCALQIENELSLERELNETAIDFGHAGYQCRRMSRIAGVVLRRLLVDLVDCVVDGARDNHVASPWMRKQAL